jgi:hypothetical protein
VEAAFEHYELPGWQWAAEDAARDWKPVIGKYKKTP